MSNAPGSPQPVTLSATVIAPLVSFSPSSLNFGSLKRTTSSTLNITVGNPGGTALIFSDTGISITGANAASFTQTNTCGAAVASGTRCTVAVKFSPPTRGKFSASLTFVDNAQTGRGTQVVALSGTGY